MYRIPLLIIILSVLLSSCVSFLNQYAYKPINYIDESSDYAYVNRLYEKESSFNDDIEMPIMSFLGLKVKNKRYVKDPTYKPQGGEFQYRFLELKKLTSLIHGYTEKKEDNRSIDKNYTPLPEALGRLFKHHKNADRYLLGVERARKKVEKVENKLINKDLLDLAAQKKILYLKEGSKKTKEKYNDALLNHEITKLWNSTVNNTLSISKQKKSATKITHYKKKLYLIHKLFINDLIDINVVGTPKVDIDHSKFERYYTKINYNDRVRFEKLFNSKSNPKELAEKIKHDFNKELSSAENWNILLKSAINPKYLDTYNIRLKKDVGEGTYPNIPIIFDKIVKYYIKEPKKAFLINSEEGPIFVDRQLGYLYIDKKFWKKIQKNHTLRNTILKHEAAHVKFNILINPEKMNWKKKYKSIEIDMIELVSILGIVAGLSEKEINHEVKKKIIPLKLGNKKAYELFDKYQEFIVDGEAFDKEMTPSVRAEFIAFMQSRHTGFNRYKIKKLKENGCFRLFEIKHSEKNISGYDNIYKEFIQGGSYYMSGDEECSTIQMFLNRNNIL